MGVFEILIVVVIALVVFGGYFRKHLPQLGRSAGRNARIGTEKARELADTTTGKVGEKVGDKLDPATMGRTAGKHVRDAREFRDSFKGTFDMTPAEKKPAVEPSPPAPAATAAPAPAHETPAPAPEPETESKPDEDTPAQTSDRD